MAASILCRKCSRLVQIDVYTCRNAARHLFRSFTLPIAYGSQCSALSAREHPSYFNFIVSHPNTHGLKLFSQTTRLPAQSESHEEKKSTRNTKIKEKLEKVKVMREDIVTIPNLLSSLRIVSAPVISYLIITEDFNSAALLFGAAGITDLLDGYIARNFKNQKSVFGTALDPLADKILMSIVTVSLTAVSLLPVPLAVLILGRDALLVATAFFLRYQSLPAPKTVSRYFDINLPTVELRPHLISKANTVLQLALIGITLVAPVFGFVDHPHLQYFWYVVGGSTFFSGVSYVIGFKSAFKYIK